MKKKNNLVGLAMAASIGVCAGILYFVGKVDGRCEAYVDIANQLESLAKEAAKTEK